MTNTRTVHTYLASTLHSAVSFLCWLPVLLLTIGVGICPASVLTAHFSGAQIALGGGLSQPRGVAVDSSGNVYVADSAHNQVKEIPAGCFSQACTQQLGGSYAFNSPKGMAVDAGGNVYVADSSANKIEVMTPNCTSSACVTRLGGSYGFNGPTAVAVDSGGNVFVADYGNGRVEAMTAGCTNSACVGVIGSGFSQPDAVAVDSSGNVYVSDDNRSPIGIYEITAGSGYTTVTQIASGFGFSSPRGVALDAAGNLFVSDANLNAVEEITFASGYSTVITLASNYSSPRGVAVDASDNVYIGDYGNNAVEEVKRSNASFGTVNIGSASASPITLIFGFDTGGIVQAPVVLTQGMTGLDFTAASGGTCTAGSYSANNTCTVNVAFMPQGAGTRYGAAVLRNSGGAAIATAYVFGTGVGPQVAFLPSVVSPVGSGVSAPHGIQADANGNLYVADTGANEIVEIPAPGYGTLNVLGGGFNQPRGVAVDGAGNVFVGDGGNQAVKEIPPGCVSSTCVVTLGGSFSFVQPYGVAVDGNGNVFVNDYALSRVYEILAAGGYTTVNRLASSFTFWSPYGIAVDGSGNVFLADETNNAVREILAAGGYTTVVTLGSGFSAPRDVAVDGSGNVYVADGGNSAVKEILAASGYVTVQTLGSGYATPEGVAVDGAGNVYDAIAGYSYLLKEGYSGAPTFNFNATNVGLLSTDSPQSVTLLNNGNAPLLIPIPNSGVNPGFSFTSYTLDGATTCPAINAGGGEAGTLAAGNSCVLAVDFTPAGSGANNDALVLTDNNLNAAGPGYTSQSITLNGVGNAPAPPPQTTPTITWAPPANINNGADLTAVLTATASVSGSYAYTATPAGGTAAAVSTATVLAPASYSLNLTFTPDDLVDYTTATASATLTVNANFGGAGIGSPSATPMTVTFLLNGAPGNGTLAAPQVLTQGAAGLDFTDAGTGNCTAGMYYSGGVTCTVGVTFTPKYAGARYGAVVLKDSAGTVAATQYVSGTGMGPQVSFLPPSSSIQVFTGSDLISGVAVDGSGNVFAANHNGHTVEEVPAGCLGDNCLITVGGGFSTPYGVAVDGAGNVFVADVNYPVVKEVPAGCMNAGCVLALGSGFGNPNGVAVDGAGNIFVTSGDNSVKELLAAGGYTTVNTLGGGFNQPFGPAVDGNGNVFFANQGDGTVKEILAAGGYTTVNTLGSGFSYPNGVAVDAAGNVFVADVFNDAVKEILASGGYATILNLGSCSQGYQPAGVAVDGSGNLFVASLGVAKLDLADAPAVAFLSPTLMGTSDTADGAQIVTVENVGNQPLTFAALIYPADFPETGGSDCSMSAPLAAGAVCPLTIGFAPDRIGNLNETLFLVDNSLNQSSNQSLSVTGRGTLPTLTPNVIWAPPATINFGSDLSSILNATAVDPKEGLPVEGTFSYTATPAGGSAAPVTSASILAPGSYLLTAMFTPAGQDFRAVKAAAKPRPDMKDSYTTATGTAPLTVDPNFTGGGIGTSSPTAMTLTFILPGTPGNGTLGAPLVLTQGVAGLDFTDATTGSCTAGTNYSGGITCTVGVTFTPKYAGTRYGAVVLTDSAGTVVQTQYVTGTGLGPQVNFLPGTGSTVTTSSLTWPFGAAVDAGGNLYIADSVNNRILKETPTSGSYSESTIAGGLLSSPEGVAVDGAGNVYIADSGDGQVLMAPWTGSGYGTPVTVANSALNGLYGPEGVAVDGAGNVYVADTGNSRVLQFPWTGNGYGAAVTVANATLNGLSTPDGVAVDGSGNVYVADTGNSQVLQFPWTGSGYGTPVTVANSALNGLSYPYGIAVDGLGNVYIADTYKGRVVKETLSGASYTQSVVASGLDDPEGVAVDGSGNVYLTNSGIGVLLKEDFADAPAVTFPTPTVAGSADTTDGAQIVTLENVGNQPLTFSALTYPADFPETGSNDCSMSAQLAAGASCPLTMHFVPASNGPIADFLVLGDNALNSPGSTQTITLNGTGVSVFAKFGFAGLPASLALGTPQAMILTAENSSGATLTSYTGTAQLSSSDPNAVFSLSSGGAPIASYTFIPSDGGVRSLYVTFETAGSQSIMATDAVAGVSSSSGGVLLSQTTPTITWLQPLAIGYGVALSSTQLNATASVAGTFTYTPAAGSVLNAGGQTLSVVFTPTDGINYSTANGSVSLTVNKAPATVIPDAGTKTYGTSDAVLTGTLSGFLAADNVSATYSRAVGETVAGGPYTISATLNPVGVLGNYNIAYNTANFTITKALLTVTASNASMLYGAVPPNLGGTMVGVVAGDGITASFTTAATSSSQPGPYAITPVLSDPNGKLGNYNEVFNDGTLTIGTDTTTTTVQTSAATVLAQNNVTFTAKVSGAASTPAGSVSFLDGGTALGTAPLDNTGSATLTLSTLSVGAHNITAVYAGNVDFVGSASSAITETVQDFNFTISGAAVTVLSATVEPGSTAVYTLQLTPTSGATFAGTVALTLTGVPAGATYTVTPSSIAEGSGITTVTVTVNIPKQQPGVSSPSPKDSDGLPKPLLMVLFLPLLGMGKVRRALRARMKSPVLMLAMLGVLMAVGMTACGSGSGSLTQPPQSSAMMLTGTSGGLHHSITLNLTVQ